MYAYDLICNRVENPFIEVVYLKVVHCTKYIHV